MLKNYTSSVSAARSVAFIEAKLASNGARDIIKRYDGNQCLMSIVFTIPMPKGGGDMVFKLPARVAECTKVLEANLSSRVRPETRKKIPVQAERTAWKILSDWVEAQMAMIELAQVELFEVFLPYAYDPVKEQTFFEKIKEHNYRALLTDGKKARNAQ